MNSKVTLVLRILLGLIMVVFGANKLYEFMPMPEMEPSLGIDFYNSLVSTGYFLTFLGIIEVIGGLLLFSKKYAALGAVVLMPITANIFMYHITIAHEGIFIGIVVLVLNVLIAFASKDKYKELF